MTTATHKNSALDNFKLDYEDIPMKMERIRFKPPRKSRFQFRRPPVLRPYINYMIEIILA